MLNSFCRRALFAAAMAALHQAASPASGSVIADLAASSAPRAAGPGRRAAAPPPTGRVVRHSLGPVPGFTVPITADTAEKLAAVSDKRHGAGVFGAVGDWLSHLQDATASKVKVTGHETLTMRMDKVSGNLQSFQQDQYLGQGTNGV